MYSRKGGHGAAREQTAEFRGIWKKMDRLSPTPGEFHFPYTLFLLFSNFCSCLVAEKSSEIFKTITEKKKKENRKEKEKL